MFRYRMVSRVNVYSIDGFEDYYYGYMVQNTSYIRYFDLLPYHYGFVLMLPNMRDPRRIPAFVPQEKLFAVLAEASRWGRLMQGWRMWAALNEAVSRGEMSHLILIQEALQEKKDRGDRRGGGGQAEKCKVRHDCRVRPPRERPPLPTACPSSWRPSD